MRNLQEELVKLVVRHRKAKSRNRNSLDLKFQSKSLLPLTIRTRSGPTITKKRVYSHLNKGMCVWCQIKERGEIVGVW